MPEPALLPPRVLVPPRVTGAPPPLGQVVHALGGETMGTTWTVRVLGPAGLRPAVVEPPLRAALDTVVAEMSHWQPASRLSRFNRAPAGSRHALPPGFATVMAAALAVAAASGGAFDPTAGAAVRRWGFGPPGAAGAVRAQTPGPADWRALDWDGESLWQPGGVELDLGAIAKGYAVDLLSSVLWSLYLPHHLVEVGGELRGRGVKPDGQPWWVDVEPPDPACRLPGLRLALHGLAVATSGDYRRYRLEADGRRLSHTLDPRTGEPIAHGLAAVSVVHESAMWADGWSTALMVLGSAAGRALAAERGLAARFVQRTATGYAETLSPALAELLA